MQPQPALYAPSPTLIVPLGPSPQPLRQYTGRVLRVDPDLGNIYVPVALTRLTSLPGCPVRRAFGEMATVTMVHKRPIRRDDGLIAYWAIIDKSVTHNERVNDGTKIQVNRVHGTVGTTSNGVISAVGLGNANFTKTATDRSIGSASQSVTTNEFTTIALSRVAGTVQNFTAGSTLGGTFSVDIYKSFSPSGSGTVYGAALFDQVTVASSNMYAEDLYSSSASVVNGDTLNNTYTIQN